MTMPEAQKISAEAKRLLERGQFRKALPLFQRAAEEDPNDLRHLLRVGDVLHRMGDLGPALTTYLDAARKLTDHGFLLRAVAVYRQMLRIDPGLHPVHAELARVYAMIGLVNDAISQYQEGIRVLQARGRPRDRLELIRELLELDPDNVRARVRLAEDFLAEGAVAEGVTELRLCCETLNRIGRHEEFLRVAERVLHHEPEDLILSRQLAETYLEHQDPQRALPRIQACFRAQPNDPDLLRLLATCFRLLGQSHKAVTVLKELARLHERQGRLEAIPALFEEILTVDPSDQSARRIVGDRMKRTTGPAELGFDEIAFDELDDRDLSTGSRTPSQMRRLRDHTPTPAAFDNLDQLVEMVASEPVSNADIRLPDRPAVSREATRPPKPPPVTPKAPLVPPPLPPPSRVEAKPEAAAPVSITPAELRSQGPARVTRTTDNSLEFELDVGQLDTGSLGGPSGDNDRAAGGAPSPLESSLAGDVPIELAGELREFDFYLRNELPDAARLVLEELPAEFHNHPEVLRRRIMLPR